MSRDIGIGHVYCRPHVLFLIYLAGVSGKKKKLPAMPMTKIMLSWLSFKALLSKAFLIDRAGHLCVSWWLWGFFLLFCFVFELINSFQPCLV